MKCNLPPSRLVLSVGFLMLPALAVFGQAPPNDAFANAITINGPIATVTGSNVGATKQFGAEPNNVGGSFGGASVWWNWTAIASGATTIDTEGSDFNTLLGVFTGAAANALTLVADNDNFAGNQWSRVMFNAVAGTTYRIYVDGFRTGGGPGGMAAQGNIVLNVKGVGGLDIVTPTNTMVFTVGQPVPVVVNVTTNFPNPPPQRMDFFVNGVQFASSATAPFSAMASNLPPGSNFIHVAALDSMGLPVQSPTVNILVQNVGVTLLTPADGTYSLNANPITATAWAYLPAGAITNIEFQVDGVTFAEDATAPYSGVWSNVVGGSHRLVAVGRSDSGATYKSQPVNIGVATSLVPTGAVWRFLDTGADPGPAWIAPTFDDSAWGMGRAELGYGDNDETTVVASGPTGNFYITTYFRHAFHVANPAAFISIGAALERDDAGVVYLNGREIFRTPNLPAAPTVISNTTLATGAAVEDTIDSFTLNPTNLITGSNVLAVEIHQQAINSSDISFNFQMLGIPAIIRNESPLVAVVSPATNDYFIAPPAIPVEATASDNDGSVTNVEFFADGVKIGEAAASPYLILWTAPPVGAHVFTAVATDDQGATETSAPVPIVVYDAFSTPVTAITSPANGAVMEGPTNLLVTASAHAIAGVASVQLLADGVPFGSASAAPYSAVWTAPFGVTALRSVVTDVNGARGTSAPVSVTITIPPTNVIAPTVAGQSPSAGATVTNLTSIQVVFSERVQNVSAGDLLINGVAATNVTSSSLSNYTFTFPQPLYGQVLVNWVNGHGITDYGFPAPLPFDETGPGAVWIYDLVDRVPPFLTARTPGTNVLVTNLSEVVVTFSEPVSGVDAADLLVAGTPAFSVSAAGNTYTFAVSQPPAGTINVTWATNHGIADLALVPNPFNRTNGAWSFVLDNRTVIAQSNGMWRFVKGTSEASSPTNAWRFLGFDDSGWSNAPAPFFYGDPYSNGVPAFTHLFDMQSNYTTIYLRREFTVPNRNAITNLFLNAQVDDGFVAWINGVEVARANVAAGDPPYNAVATQQSQEPQNNGSPYIAYNLTNGPGALVAGTNILAIQALNQSLTTSSDFGFNAQLYTFVTDFGRVAPRLAQAAPTPGDVLALTNITVTFTEPVTNVDAGDLLVNGVPAASVVSTNPAIYRFSFLQPPYGPVEVTWLGGHSIVDFDDVPKPFDGNAVSSILRYTLINPSNPRVFSQLPVAGTLITNLLSVTVNFTEPVQGVDAADFLINGTSALSVAGGGSNYVFTVAQPPYGTVAIRWLTNHGITDLESPAHDFDPTRFGGQWNYNLVDPVPSVAITSPTNGSFRLAPATFPVNVTAIDRDGTIRAVEFFQNGVFIGQDTNTPYALTVSNLLEGIYTFVVVATDNTGISATSAPVTVSVVTNLPITLVRGPYLQSGSPVGGIIRWRTDTNSDAVVYYGTNPNALTNVATEAALTNDHIVMLSGLAPDTQYFYSIGSTATRLAGTNGAGSEYWFKTSPVPGTRKPTRLWILGDAGTAGNGPADRQNATRDAFYNFAATNGGLPDLWLMLGDNAYNVGSDTEHQRAVFEIYPTLLRNKFLWPTIGNHETSQSTTATDFPYLHIFSLPTAGEAGGVPSGTEKYYSFDYANIHFICLDSMTSGRTATTPMAQWLQDDLAATTAEWIIVFFHHPPYTKGSHDSDAETDLIQLRQNLNPIFEANGVDLVLGGHSHSYERSFLLHGHYGNSSTLTASMKLDAGDGRTNGTGAYTKNESGEGVVYTVTGSAGQATFATTPDRTFNTTNHPAHFVSFLELGTMVVDVVSNRLEGFFLTTNGVARDRFTLQKREVAPRPRDFIATAIATNAIALAWTDAATNEIRFSIERSLDGTNFSEVLTAPVNATAATDTGLLMDTTYFYRIRAINFAGPSDYSQIARATTWAFCPTALAQSLTTDEDTALPIVLAASGGGVTGFRITQPPAHGTLQGAAPNLVYVPNPNFPTGAGHTNGADSFAFTARNALCESAPAVVTIAVREINDGPVDCHIVRVNPRCAMTFAGDPAWYVLATPAGGWLAATTRATDPEGDALQYLWMFDGVPVSAVSSVTSLFSAGCHTLTLQVSDGLIDCSAAQPICTITPMGAVERCMQMVRTMITDAKDQHPLMSSLESAHASFTRGNYNSGRNQLHAFQNKVRAQVTRDYPSAAAPLTQCAQQIMDALDCPTAPPAAPPAARPALTLARMGASQVVFWSDPTDGFILEATHDLSGAAPWQPMTAGLLVDGANRACVITNTANPPTCFFRLSPKNAP